MKKLNEGSRFRSLSARIMAVVMAGGAAGLTSCGNQKGASLGLRPCPATCPGAEDRGRAVGEAARKGTENLKAGVNCVSSHTLGYVNSALSGFSKGLNGGSEKSSVLSTLTPNSFFDKNGNRLSVREGYWDPNQIRSVVFQNQYGNNEVLRNVFYRDQYGQLLSLYQLVNK